MKSFKELNTDICEAMGTAAVGGNDQFGKNCTDSEW